MSTDKGDLPSKQKAYAFDEWLADISEGFTPNLVDAWDAGRKSLEPEIERLRAALKAIQEMTSSQVTLHFHCTQAHGIAREALKGAKRG